MARGCQLPTAASSQEVTMHCNSLTSRAKRRLAAQFLSTLVAAIGLLIPLGVSAQTTIKFIAWNFQVETVNEFVKQFEAENPGIKVDLEIIPSAQFAAKIQLMKNGNTPFDALYV